MQADKPTARTSRRLTSRGFTLAEALIASAFLAIATLGVSVALQTAAKQSIFVRESANCQALARELIEEMTSRSFVAQTNPGYSSGATDRATYDDVADYDGYTDNSTSGIKTLQGTTIDFGDSAVYTRTAKFEYRTSTNGAKAASGDFGMATVTVKSSSGASVTLQRFLTNPVIAK
jgi:Tfp pilus assembly protein PilV